MMRLSAQLSSQRQFVLFSLWLSLRIGLFISWTSRMPSYTAPSPRQYIVCSPPGSWTPLVRVWYVASTNPCMAWSRLLVHGITGLLHICPPLALLKPSPTAHCSSTAEDLTPHICCCTSTTLSLPPPLPSSYTRWLRHFSVSLLWPTWDSFIIFWAPLWHVLLRVCFSPNSSTLWTFWSASGWVRANRAARLLISIPNYPKMDPLLVTPLSTAV